ncbi:MAG: hypothetical protein KC473_05080, partial [Candidatus Dadabacteria bacterium]|nr:hypothetical protein [Candidatus Dadabacteria bacterium]
MLQQVGALFVCKSVEFCHFGGLYANGGLDPGRGAGDIRKAAVSGPRPSADRSYTRFIVEFTYRHPVYQTIIPAGLPLQGAIPRGYSPGLFLVIIEVLFNMQILDDKYSKIILEE